MILAIDTSTKQAGVALFSDGDIQAESVWIAGGNHSRTLTPAIVELLSRSGRVLSELTSIAVASGPGSFSGLRVGISEAKGLATALDVPLVGVSTLDCIAFQAIGEAERVWAVIPAGRQQVYLAPYAGGYHAFHREADYQVVPVVEAVQLVDGLVAGEGAAMLDGERSGFRTQGPPWRPRRPGFLAELGSRYLDAGGKDQRDTLEPLYLRRSAAEEKRMGSTH